MWPNLIGPGWQSQLALAAGLLFAVIATFKVLAVFADRMSSEEAPDPLLNLWHRYEEGDLTRQEFERLRRSFRKAPVSQGRGDRRTQATDAEVHRAPAS